jgi:type VI secretion system protein ImpE
MTARELLKQSKPDEALACLQADIKKQPGDAGLRLGLFQILALRGQWERALAQVQTAVSLNARLAPLAQLLRNLVELEQVRSVVFEGKRQPTIFGPTPEWLALLLGNRWTIGTRRHTQIVKAHAKALESAPARAGIIDGRPFTWVTEADARFGPTLELYLQGNYCWVPFERIARIDFEKPRDLQELIWLPAKLTWVNGGTASGHIPVRYPGTETSTDSHLLLAQTVAWQELGENCLIGTGVRVLAADCGDFPITTIRVLEFTTQERGRCT